MKLLSMRPAALALVASWFALGPGCSAPPGQGCYELDSDFPRRTSGAADNGIVLDAMVDSSRASAAAIVELTRACRALALELGGDEPRVESFDLARDVMADWCKAAARALGAAEAGALATLRLRTRPQCRVSVAAKVACQATCTHADRCDVVHPFECAGGSLDVLCKGTCRPRGTSPLACEGRCEGTCTGSCSALQGTPIACDGRCDGVCSPDGVEATGIQPDGSCKGRCSARCVPRSLTPAPCTGWCEGTCEGVCAATSEGAMKCDGICEGETKLLTCTAKLEGGCDVTPACNAACDASVAAAADCPVVVPTLAFDPSTRAEDRGRALAVAIETHLPAILSARARLTGMKEHVAWIHAYLQGSDVRPICLVRSLSTIAGARADVVMAEEGTDPILAVLEDR
ncbi:MAG: hypothetical protein KF819_28645 [Labilithrix sp.]|nr:hypothetical protein [Labilithrix sp.]